MAEKKCPVNRGKLLIGLEKMRYWLAPDPGQAMCDGARDCELVHDALRSAEDALAYIGWLEAENDRLREQLPDDDSDGALIIVPLKAISRNTLVKIHKDVGGLSGMAFSVPEGKFVSKRNQILRKEAEDDAGSN